MATTRPTDTDAPPLADSRRAFLRKATLSGVAVVIGSSVVPIGSLVPPALAQAATDDPTVAAFAESLELALVDAYGTLQARGMVKTAAVKNATAMFANHHKDHAASFHDLAGSKATGKANPKLLQTINDELDAARDEAGTLGVAYQMEIAASSSYVFALGELQGEHALQVTGSIMPVESQHAVVLGQALGKTPTTDPNFLPSFVTDANKIDPAKFPMP